MENTRKDKQIEQLEGDLKTVNEVQNMENLQYMRHTLKFLCHSSSSEQQMILPAVAQLLKMKYLVVVIVFIIVMMSVMLL